MTMRLTLISHAATPAMRASAFPGDVPLEARELAALRHLPPVPWRADRALASPMQAALQTASGLALVCTEDDALRDLDVGEWAGRTIVDISEREPEKLAKWFSDPNFNGHRGESLTHLFARAAAWLEQYSGERGHTVAVSHAAVIRAIIIGVLGAPLDAVWRVDIAPLTMATLTHDGRRWALRSCGVSLAGKAAVR